jgi:hypothetical protein
LIVNTIVEDSNHTFYIETKDGSFLGHGADLLLGTSDDVLTTTPTGNPLPTSEPIVYPTVDETPYYVITYLEKENEMTSNIVEIEARAFYGTESLTNLKFNNTLEAIGDYAFSYSGLEEITVNPEVHTFGEYVFAYIDTLKKATVDSVDNGKYMFAEDKNLEKTYLTLGTQYISEGMFYKDPKLTSVFFTTHFIEAVHISIPNGEGATDEAADSEGDSTTSVIREGIKVLATTSGDPTDPKPYTSYTNNGHTYIYGSDLELNLGFDEEIVKYNGTDYKVLGHNLFQALSYTETTVLYGDVYVGDTTLHMSSDAINLSQTPKCGYDGDYSFIKINNVNHLVGNDNNYNTNDDVLYVEIGGVRLDVEEINGSYYSLIKTNIYYLIDTDTLRYSLCYLEGSTFKSNIIQRGSKYFIDNRDDSQLKGTYYKQDADDYLYSTNDLVIIDSSQDPAVIYDILIAADNNFYITLTNNVYNKVTVRGTSSFRYEYAFVSAGPDLIIGTSDDIPGVIVITDTNVYAYPTAVADVYKTYGPDNMLGTADDVILLWGSSIIQGSVTFVQYPDGYYYHDNSDNTYIRMS